MKFDSLKNKKIGLPIYLIAVSVILLFALIFGLIFGFNKGFDFSGGTQIIVDLDNSALQSKDDLMIDQFIDYATNKTKDIINKNNGKIYSLQVQKTNFGRSIIVNIRQKDYLVIRQIRLDINQEFNDYKDYLDLVEKNEQYKILDQEYDITKNTIEMDGFILPNTVIACIAGLLFAIAAVTLYTCFRLKMAAGLTLAFGGLLDLVLFCALMILSRIEINTYFFALLAIILLVSVYNSLEFFFDIREKLKDPKFDSKTNKELSTIILKENFIKNVSIYAVCLGIALIIGIFGVVPILHLGLATVFALVVVFVTHIFILPDFWVLLNKKNEFVRPVPKQKKEEVEVSTSKNNVDKSAKVVEVEEDNGEDENSTNIEEDEVIVDEVDNNEVEEDDEVVIEVLEDTDSKKD